MSKNVKAVTSHQMAVVDRPQPCQKGNFSGNHGTLTHYSVQLLLFRLSLFDSEWEQFANGIWNIEQWSDCAKFYERLYKLDFLLNVRHYCHMMSV